MGGAGEFGVCLGDVNRVGCALASLKLYFRACEPKKAGVMRKAKGSYAHVVGPRVLGKWAL